MKVTRRAVLGTVAVPALAGLGSWALGPASVHTPGIVYDDDLETGRRFAEAVRAAGGGARPIKGERVLFGRQLLSERPLLVAGVSRSADALLIGEVAAEEGYQLATELRSTSAGCSGFCADPAWLPLNKMVVGAGSNWIEALGAWAVDPFNAALPDPSSTGRIAGPAGAALGWVLVPRGQLRPL